MLIRTHHKDTKITKNLADGRSKEMAERADVVDQERGKRRKMARHNKILFGLVSGAAAGVLCNELFSDAPALGLVQKYLSDPLGKIFLNLLIMVVIPLVFSSLALGVAQIGDLKQLGRMGFRTIIYFLVV